MYLLNGKSTGEILHFSELDELSHELPDELSHELSHELSDQLSVGEDS